MQVMLDRWQVTEYTKMCKHLTYLACSTHTHKVVMYISCLVGPLRTLYLSQALMKHSYSKSHLHIKQTTLG